VTALTLRCIKGDFVVTGPDIEPTKFKSRPEANSSRALKPEAKDWCKTHYPGSPITEIGADASRRVVAVPKGRPRKAPEPPT
jgi:hypothetical protein